MVTSNSACLQIVADSTDKSKIPEVATQKNILTIKLVSYQLDIPYSRISELQHLAAEHDQKAFQPKETWRSVMKALFLLFYLIIELSMNKLINYRL